MWNKWTKLCEANVKHYNEKPGRHGMIAGGLVALGAVVTIAGAKFLQREHNETTI